MLKSKKVLFFVAVDWFFYSHFIERAIAAKNAGFNVAVVTHVVNHREQIELAGIRVIPLNIDRRSLNPLKALITLLQLIAIYRREKPDVLHQVALKPILLGSLAAYFSNIDHLVNAVVGGGYVFSSSSYLMRVIRPMVRSALRLLLNPRGSRVIFENQDDLLEFVQAQQVRAEDAVLIRGAGVNVAAYRQKTGVNATPLIVVAARLLWDKGIGEFVEAAKIIYQKGIKARFALVGEVDPGNRATLDTAVLEKWQGEGVVEVWGFRSDMPNVWATADIACLPSYREGLPKVLLEAMAAGLPCVTTDVPGCREAVKNEVNGLLVPTRDSVALANALIRLICDPVLCKRLGARGYELALNEFSSTIVCAKTLNVYKELISPP